MSAADLKHTFPWWVSATLAFIAGFADASSFVGADGIFCAHVTGNFVVLASDVARHANTDAWLKLATFPVFVGSVLATTSIHRRMSSDVRSMRLLPLIKAAFLAIAATLPFVISTSVAGVGRSAVVTLLVIAMGIQNSLHRLHTTLGPMTTVMTGNVTQWFVEKLIATPIADPAKHRVLGFIIVAFAAGCIAGACGVAQFGFVVLYVPALLTVALRRGFSRHRT